MNEPIDPNRLEELAWCGRKLFDRGLVSSTGGNISCRSGGDVIISTTGSCLADLDEQTVVRVADDGRTIGPSRPSKELPVHLRIYQTCPWVGGVVHGHSAFAVAASTLLDVDPDDSLPAYSAGYLMRVGQLPLLPFLEAGSNALAEGVAAAVARSGHAVLLRNHGFFAVGRDLRAAFYTADELQDALQVYVLSGGRAKPLPGSVRARILATSAERGGSSPI